MVNICFPHFAFWNLRASYGQWNTVFTFNSLPACISLESWLCVCTISTSWTSRWNMMKFVVNIMSFVSIPCHNS
jgi:hypothetical protein